MFLYFIVIVVALDTMQVDVEILYIFAAALAGGLGLALAIGSESHSDLVHVGTLQRTLRTGPDRQVPRWAPNQATNHAVQVPTLSSIWTTEIDFAASSTEPMLHTTTTVVCQFSTVLY
ncbi:hypothetical protein HAPAU_33760 [Halalkalicoccus paucihalophilus]|uniref:Uncharacterized protein n=1 Tax=Halalkalicoccus paucihalophilus TaxID=1008153 RepID=A0A151A9V7_9EURY|nr:hypothetical protein HAPAU_33760 [Halalkalicoccus paucihalophilus]